MTLCVAMRYGSSIQIATDSRLTLGTAHADVAVKLMPLAVRLYHARAEGEDQPRLAYSRMLGLATVGSLPTTYIAKELLESVLSTLQFAEGVTDISMAGIVAVCARVLENVSRQICAAIFERGQGLLVLVGHCLVHDIPRAFVLDVTTSEESIGVTVEEILTVPGEEEFFRSGSDAARRHVASSTDAFPYQTVRAVSRDPTEPSVGGNVQVGLVDGGDFRIMGIRDVQVNDHLHEFSVGFYLGGLEVFGEQTLFGDTGFLMTHPFLNPFQREISDLIRRGFTQVSNTGHW